MLAFELCGNPARGLVAAMQSAGLWRVTAWLGFAVRGVTWTMVAGGYAAGSDGPCVLAHSGCPLCNSATISNTGLDGKSLACACTLHVPACGCAHRRAQSMCTATCWDARHCTAHTLASIGCECCTEPGTQTCRQPKRMLNTAISDGRNATRSCPMNATLHRNAGWKT